MIIGPSHYGYIGFSMQTTITDQGKSHILYYTNRGWDGGETFCQVKNGKIISGHQWCYNFEEEIKEMCDQLITIKVYDFSEYFKQIIRNKSLSELMNIKI